MEAAPNVEVHPDRVVLQLDAPKPSPEVSPGGQVVTDLTASRVEDVAHPVVARPPSSVAESVRRRSRRTSVPEVGFHQAARLIRPVPFPGK